MHIEYWRSTVDNLWRWKIVMRNGRVFPIPYSYKQKASMLRTIATMKRRMGRAKVERV